MLIAILVVLTGIVAVAAGRGGELSHEEVDHAPLNLGPVSATDIVLLRPPTVLWGYSTQVTDEALERIAGAIRDRDVRIVALEQRIADLTGDTDYRPPSAARHARRNQRLSDAGFYTATEPPEPVSVPAAEPGYEQDAGTGQAAAEDQLVSDEITNDQAANRSDG